jgi:branched-subunit amino acid aminotransferase/4-amino-4-deoxychorismate lyase
MNEENHVWVNSELIPYQSVDVKLFSPRVLDELVVVEDIECLETDMGPAVSYLEEHVSNFIRAVNMSGYEPGYRFDELCEVVAKTVQFNQIQDGCVRIAMYVSETVGKGKPILTIAACDWEFIEAQGKDGESKFGKESHRETEPLSQVWDSFVGP